MNASRFAAAAIVAILAAACGSSQQALAPPVTFELEQYATPSEAFYYPGTTSVQYQVTVRNDSDQQVTLHHLRLQTSGGGAYILRPTDTPVKLQVGPHQSASASFSVWGQAVGGQLFAHAPVTVRATGYFDSPKGAFLRAVAVNIPQE